MKLRLRKTSLAFLTAGLALASPAFAADFEWVGDTSNNYNTGSNWDGDPGAGPGTGDNVLIDSNANNPANIPSGNWDRRGAGATTIGGTGVVNLQAGDARLLSNGTFTMSGGILNQTGQYFLVGTGGVGTMNQSGGAITSTLSRAFALSDNNINQSGTTYNLSGGTLNVTSTATGIERKLGSIWLGKGGESDGSGPNGDGQGSAAIGSAAGDIFNVTGGAATFTRAITGSAHAQNPNQLADVRISRNSGLIVSAGSVTFDNYTDVRVGQGPSGGTNARIDVSGTGSLTVSGGTTVYIGEQDNGTLNISGGTVNLDGILSLGRAFLPGNIQGDPGATAGTGIGAINMSGGNLFAADIIHHLGSFEFTGGHIWLDGDKTDIPTFDWFNADPELVTAVYSSDLNQTHIYLIPEPATAGLGGIAVLGLLLRRRK